MWCNRLFTLPQVSYSLLPPVYRGSAVACQNVGVSYRDGEGVEADDVKAVAYFKLAADAGAADGLDCLG